MSDILGGIIGGAAGAVGSIFGSIGKNRALRRQRRMINDLKADNRNWYDRRYNEDATQRADAQAVLTATADAIRRRNRAAAATAAVTGGTDESVAAEREANSRALSDAASRIAIAGEQRKDSIEQQYRNKDDAFNQQMLGLKGQQQGVLDIAGNAIGGAASGFASGMRLFGDDDESTTSKT